MNIRIAGLGLTASVALVVGMNPAHAAPRGQMSEQQLLDRFDIDGNGTLSQGERTVAREVMQVMRREGSLGADAQKVQRVIARFDTNGDKQISATELSAMLAAARRQERTTTISNAAPQNALDMRFDANGDGQIDATEWAVEQTALAGQANAAMQLRAAMNQLSGTSATPVDTDGDGTPDATAGEGGEGCQPPDETTDSTTASTSTSASTRSGSSAASRAAQRAARAARSAQANFGAQNSALNRQQLQTSGAGVQGLAGRSALAGNAGPRAGFAGRALGMRGRMR